MDYDKNSLFFKIYGKQLYEILSQKYPAFFAEKSEDGPKN